MFVKFSDYFEHAKEYGLDLQPQDCYAMIFPFDNEDIRRLAYRFVDNNTNTVRMNEWLDRLNEAAAKWRTRWTNADGKVQSRLCFIPDVPEPVIYDSRSGDVVEHPLSILTRNIIDYLEKPANKDDLEKQFRNNPEFNADREIRFLLERGLLFEEDGRYMSLIAE